MMCIVYLIKLNGSHHIWFYFVFYNKFSRCANLDLIGIWILPIVFDFVSMPPKMNVNMGRGRGVSHGRGRGEAKEAKED